MAQSENSTSESTIHNSQIKPTDTMDYITDNQMLADFCMFLDSKGYNLVSLCSVIEKPCKYADVFAEFFREQKTVFYTNGTVRVRAN